MHVVEEESDMPPSRTGVTGLVEAPRPAPAGGPLRLVVDALRPRRRLVTLAISGPVLFALLATAGAVAPPVSWLFLVAVVALLSSVILATYVPVRGRRPDLGCTPCAAASGVSVLVAVGLVATAAQAPGPALLALGVLTFGLLQRLTGAAVSCRA